MNEDRFDPYLWDRSLPSDPEVERLERLLGRYRFQPAPDQSPVLRRVPSRWFRLVAGSVGLTAAAVLFLCAYVVSIPLFGQPGPEWRVVAREGRPDVSGRAVDKAAGLTVGGVVTTDSHSRAEIEAGRVGRIEVMPGSTVRLVATAAGRHRLAVDRGRIVARLWSPPFTFGFVTPSAEAVDVGCAFTLDVDGQGAAVVRVMSGWVQFESPAAKRLIPEGTQAIAQPGKGVGTAFVASASPAFKSALLAFDFDAVDGANRDALLGTLLDEATPSDAFTLLELRARLTREQRERLYARVATLRPPPAGVTRDAFVRGDESALERWQHSLGFPEVKRWWVHWRDVVLP